MLDSLPMVRLSCFAHSLQLVIGDGIKDPFEVKDVLKKISGIASSLHSSTHMKDQFEVFFGDASIPSACATRWNSLLFQIKAIIKLDSTNLSTVLKECGKTELLLDGLELEKLTQLTTLLDPFLEATQVTQGEKVKQYSISIFCE